jgi:hypothetical protein
MADTKKYRVLSPIGAHGKDYAAGAIIELTDKDAAAMPWAVEPLKPAAPVKPAEPQKVTMTEAHVHFLVDKGVQVDSVEKAQEFFDKLEPEGKTNFLAAFAKATEEKK